MSEYAPTTDEVRDAYTEGMEHDCYYEGDVKATPDGIYEGERFDRWLAEVERAAAEKAWTEGVATALNFAKREPDGITLKLVTIDGAAWENPYRRNEGENECCSA